jgi:hypothetical protein
MSRAVARRPAAHCRNCTGPVHGLVGAGKARRAHLHRLPAQRPRHDRDRYVVAAGAGGISDCAPVSWRQVENGIRPDAFTMEKPPRR